MSRHSPSKRQGKRRTGTQRSRAATTPPPLPSSNNVREEVDLERIDLDPSAMESPPESPDATRITMKPARWRTGLLVVVVCGLMYVPLMGSYGMYDPWETIYTEVARQFMERDDWLSPYWHNGTGPEGWAETNFWSKPVGSFWLSGVSLKLFGLEQHITLRGTGRTLEDPAKHTGPPPTGMDPGEYLTMKPVEWAVRLPFFLCGLFGILCIYLMCARLFNRRTAVLASLILATSPMYFFITRQAMTDMPYVGLISGGIALLMLAIFGQREPLSRRSWRLGRFATSVPHDAAYYLFVAVFALWMVLMLRAITLPLLRVPIGIAIAGRPLSAGLWMLIYVVSTLLAIWLSRKATTKNEVYLYIFYMATAVGGLAKGLVGLLQPGFVALLYLFVSREWWILTELALGRGLIIAGSVFAPWWHAMVVAHGPRFWSELVGTEQLRRLTIGEQSQAKGTWDYYLRQVGYGFFPWIALLPGAFARAFAIGGAGERSARDRVYLFCYVWFAAAAVLFTMSVTKYNHYILPLIPPAAILVALHIDDLMAGRARHAWLTVIAAISLLAVVTVDLVAQPANWVWMFTYLYGGGWAKGAPEGTPILIYAIACAVPLALVLWPRARRVALWSLLVVTVAGGGWVLNWYQVECAPHWGQKKVLQTYYRLRKGPEEQLIAWQFNWRGETWYTAAQVVVSKSLDNTAIKKWLRERPGRKFFFITERGRYSSLSTIMPTDRGRKSLHIVDDSNAHFILAEAQL